MKTVKALPSLEFLREKKKRLVRNGRKILVGLEERNGERERETDIRKGGGENGKWMWSEREQASVMVECTNIQLTCHAPHIRKNTYNLTAL